MVKLAGGHPSRHGAMRNDTTGRRTNRLATGSAHSIAWELPSTKKSPLAECEIGSFAGGEPVAGSHIVEREKIKSGKIGQSRGYDGKEARMRRAGESGLVVARERAENKQDLSKEGKVTKKKKKF